MFVLMFILTYELILNLVFRGVSVFGGVPGVCRYREYQGLFRSFQCVSCALHECSRGFQGKSGAFQGILKACLGVSTGFMNIPCGLRWLQEVSGVFEGYSRGFRGVLTSFRRDPEDFSDVSGVFKEFQECYSVIQKVSWSFQGFQRGFCVFQEF